MAVNSTYSYLGKTITFPLTLENGGRLGYAEGVDCVNQSIQRILGTPKGSVLFNRDYGSRIEELLFAPNTEVISALMATEINEALQTNESRITDINVTSAYKDDIIDVAISYRLVSTGEFQSTELTLKRKATV